jgi:site-specific DNA-methyltransferase (adenine-specific)
MTEPYWTDAEHNLVLYCDDTLRLTPWLKAAGVLPEQTMTVTDPPYNVGMNYGDDVDDSRDADVYLNWTSNWFGAAPRPLVVTPGQANLEMWCSYIEWPTAIIPWLKPNQASPSKLGGFNAWEAILLYGKLPRRLGHDAFVMPIGQQAEVTSRTGKKHPCPKYLPFWIKLLGNMVAPGWTVFDPFVGSGTTMLAAKRLGLPCVGIELKPEFCDLTIERLRQEVMPFPEVEIDETSNYRLTQQLLGLELRTNGEVVEIPV